MSRARPQPKASQPLAPEWPKSLQLRAVEAPPAPAADSAPRPVTLFLFGVLKDRRTVAAEVDMRGREVLALRPLMASHYVEPVAKVWQQCMYTRQVERRAYSLTEEQANRRDGRGVEASMLASWAAVGLVEAPGRKTVATALEYDGEAVGEPRILAHGDRQFCWLEALDWAERNMLPRRKS